MIIAVSILGGMIFGLIFFIAIQHRKKAIPTLQTISRLKNLESKPVEIKSNANNSSNRNSIFNKNQDVSQLTFSQRVIVQIINSVRAIFLKLAPQTIFQTIDRYIILAGKQDSWNSYAITFAWGFSILGFLALGILFVTVIKLLWIQKIIVMMIFGSMGAMMPLSFFRSVIRKRQERIVMQLPSFLDLLSISVQAGLSFDAAVDRIVKHSEGPLIDEFRRMQRDLRLGLSKRDSLKQMAERCDVEEVHLFTTSIIQADKLGTSMGKTLVDQADNMRDRYQQYIKAKALKAPIKMLFPLLIFIFPVIFVVVLVPTLITLVNNFSAVPGF